MSRNTSDSVNEDNYSILRHKSKSSGLSNEDMAYQAQNNNNNSNQLEKQQFVVEQNRNVNNFQSQLAVHQQQQGSNQKFVMQRPNNKSYDTNQRGGMLGLKLGGNNGQTVATMGRDTSKSYDMSTNQMVLQRNQNHGHHQNHGHDHMQTNLQAMSGALGASVGGSRELILDQNERTELEILRLERQRFELEKAKFERDRAEFEAMAASRMFFQQQAAAAENQARFESQQQQQQQQSRVMSPINNRNTSQEQPIGSNLAIHQEREPQLQSQNSQGSGGQGQGGSGGQNSQQMGVHNQMRQVQHQRTDSSPLLARNQTVSMQSAQSQGSSHSNNSNLAMTNQTQNEMNSAPMTSKVNYRKSFQSLDADRIHNNFQNHNSTLAQQAPNFVSDEDLMSSTNMNKQTPGIGRTQNMNPDGKVYYTQTGNVDHGQNDMSTVRKIHHNLQVNQKIITGGQSQGQGPLGSPLSNASDGFENHVPSDQMEQATNSNSETQMDQGAEETPHDQCSYDQLQNQLSQENSNQRETSQNQTEGQSVHSGNNSIINQNQNQNTNSQNNYEVSDQQRELSSRINKVAGKPSFQSNNSSWTGRLVSTSNKNNGKNAATNYMQRLKNNTTENAMLQSVVPRIPQFIKSPSCMPSSQNKNNSNVQNPSVVNQNQVAGMGSVMNNSEFQHKNQEMAGSSNTLHSQNQSQNNSNPNSPNIIYDENGQIIQNAGNFGQNNIEKTLVHSKGSTGSNDKKKRNFTKSSDFELEKQQEIFRKLTTKFDMGK